MTNNLISYSLLSIIFLPFLGFNFIISFLGNILILLFLIPFLIIAITFLSIKSFQSKIKQCENCGATIVGGNEICIYCGSNLDIAKNNDEQLINDASNKTIEIKAEEIK